MSMISGRPSSTVRLSDLINYGCKPPPLIAKCDKSGFS